MATTPAQSSAFKTITDEDFDTEVLQAQGPVIVFFWAPYSDACKEFIPAIEGFAADRLGDAKLVKVNVEKYMQAATRKAKIAALPALLLYQDGKVQQEIIGTCKREVAVAMWDKAKSLQAPAR